MSKSSTTDETYAITAEVLLGYVTHYEQLEAEKQDTMAIQKDILTEAKSRGYDTKVLKRIIAERKRKPDELAEEESILEIYRAALGMQSRAAA